jgi:hypothetical protein
VSQRAAKRVRISPLVGEPIAGEPLASPLLVVCLKHCGLRAGVYQLLARERAANFVANVAQRRGRAFHPLVGKPRASFLLRHSFRARVKFSFYRSHAE